MEFDPCIFKPHTVAFEGSQDVSPRLDNAVCQQGAAIRGWRLRGITFNVKHIPKLSLIPNKIWCLGFGNSSFYTLGVL